MRSGNLVLLLVLHLSFMAGRLRIASVASQIKSMRYICATEVLTEKDVSHGDITMLHKYLSCMSSFGANRNNKICERRGLLIVFEGCDRSGKSTQAKELVKALTSKGEEVELMRFPERKTRFGKVIEAYLKKEIDLNDRLVHLAFSVNRWEFNKDMRRKLNNGITLVIDRYAFSGVAYTAAKGFSIPWCKGPDRGLPAPDAIFYLDAPLDKTSSRGGYGMERYEKNEFQQKVYNVYKKLMDDSWHIIKADRSIEVIHEEIKNLTLDLQKTVTALGSLWVDGKTEGDERLIGEDIEKFLARKEDSEDCVAFLNRLAKEFWLNDGNEDNVNDDAVMDQSTDSDEDVANEQSQDAFIQTRMKRTKSMSESIENDNVSSPDSLTDEEYAGEFDTKKRKYEHSDSGFESLESLQDDSQDSQDGQ